MPYVTYLRKSRADLDLERAGGEDTLSRHRRALRELADRMGLSVAAVYEEVVSGDSIAARPQMQRLLNEVQDGIWEGVLVMEVERLARGDTMDQGLVANAFKYSGTKIITPAKVYDPASDIDEEYFEFSLFMSRREYKTINRRLKAGKHASMREGKFVSSVAPYGYDRQKLRGEKGYTLVPNKDADTVRMIFRLYLKESYTTTAIVKHLNALGIPTARGRQWSEASIQTLLRNAHYAGYTSNGFRPAKKIIVDGQVRQTRPRNADLQLFEGRHEPLVSREDWRAVQERLARNKRPPIPKIHGAENPLCGLVYCDQCGNRMQRRNIRNGSAATIMCHTRGCPTVMHDMLEVESLVLDALRAWYARFSVESCTAEDAAPQLENARSRLSRLDAELDALALREQRTYEFLEGGTYTPAEFKSRRAALQADRAKLTGDRAQLLEEIHKAERAIESRLSLLPQVRHVLDVYDSQPDALQRNQLLKTVLLRVDYHKTTRATRANHDTDLKVIIYPAFDRFL